MRSFKFWQFYLLLTLLSPCAGFGYSTISPVKEIQTEAAVFYLNAPYLFVGGYTKLSIFDINNPADPKLVSEVPSPYLINGITVVGDRAYAVLDVAGQENMMIVDISSITAPAVVDTRYAGPQDSRPCCIYSVGRELFVGLDRGGINAIRVSDDNKLVQLSTLKTGDNLMDFVSKGNRLYASSWSFEIYVVDISDPANLRLVNTVSTDDVNNRMDINNNLLAVAEGPTGTTFYNLNDPDSPKRITTFRNSMNETYAVSLRENYCYTARLYYNSNDVTSPDWDGGLTILDYESLPNVKLDKLDDLADALDVLAYDGYVYLAGSGVLNVYKHGPAGVRPTSTPVLPTATPTFTPSLTPTNTPRLIPTAIPTGIVTTAVPTNTSIPVVVPTATQTPTKVVTQPPEDATPTPNRLLVADYVFEFDKSKLGDNGWSDTVLGGFAGNPSGFVKIIPLSESYFPLSFDKKGLMFLVSPVADANKPDQVCFIYATEGIEIGANPVFIRAYVKSEGDGGNAELYIGALKGSFTKGGVDGSIAFISPKNSKNFIKSKGIHCYYEPDDDNQIITPFIQIAAKKGGGDATVYVDRIEVFILKPGVKYDGALFESTY